MRQRRGGGLQAASAAGPAERTGQRRAEPAPARAPRRSQGRGGGRRGGGGERPAPGGPLPLRSDARRVPGAAELLEVVHRLQVALGLLEDLLGQLLGVEQRCRDPLLLGLDGAVRLRAGLVRLGAAQLAFSERRRAGGYKGVCLPKATMRA